MKHYADEVNLHARIYAMKSRLLSLEDYAAMARDKDVLYETIPEAHDYIEAKEMIFAQQVKDIIHLAEATERYAPLFVAFLRMFEANNAKLILAKAYSRQTQQQWYDIGPYATFRRGLLREDLTLSEIKALLAQAFPDEDFEHTVRGNNTSYRVQPGKSLHTGKSRIN